MKKNEEKYNMEACLRDDIISVFPIKMQTCRRKRRGVILSFFIFQFTTFISNAIFKIEFHIVPER